MRTFSRSVVTAFLCGVAVFAGDALFRASLLDRVRPIIVTPVERAAVKPPIRLSWEGPGEMEVLLAAHDGEASSLGVQRSPFDIGGERFPRPGGYEVRLRDARWGDWIGARRSFQVHGPRSLDVAEDDSIASPLDESRTLLRAFDAARKARDKARARIRTLRKDNATLSSEAERLAIRLDEIYATQDEGESLLGALEGELVDAVSEIRLLREQNIALSLRLAGVNPCTVWGYFTFPRPQTIPPTRRMVRVSDNNGTIFRSDAFCNQHRRVDPSATSGCFCVGDTWAGS